MKNNTTLWNIKASCAELKSVQVIALCGILLALRVVIGFLEINIESIYRISFAALPVSLGGMLFGPVAGGILGGLRDIVTLLIKPIGALNPGIVLSKILSGFIMGLFLYKRPISLKRTVLACTVSAVLCDLVVTTASLYWMYGTPLAVMLPWRIVNYISLLPVNAALLYGAQKLVVRIHLPALKNRG